MTITRKHFDILVALAESSEALSQRDLEKEKYPGEVYRRFRIPFAL